ncbi:MAG: co-chaperone GroES [Candidatus Sericytochromatia bacterium]|nr:co-chaperone GroES [Candidatus Sericytochromatia bacterium]
MPATATKIRPLGDRVVVKVVKEEKTAGGLVLPDTAQEKPQTGEVLAVGPGKTLDNGSRQTVDVAIGDKVLFAKYSGTEVKLDGETYLLIAEKDILGVIS